MFYPALHSPSQSQLNGSFCESIVSSIEKSHDKNVKGLLGRDRHGELGNLRANTECITINLLIRGPFKKSDISSVLKELTV